MCDFLFSTTPGNARRLCRKRIVTCVLLDQHDRVVSIGVNTCVGDSDGGCFRLGMESTPDEYRIGNSNQCNSLHAEIDALRRVDIHQLNSSNRRLVRAIISGHSFVCPACEEALRDLGVTSIEFFASTDGVMNEQRP